MALAAAAISGGMHRRIHNQTANPADKEIAESRRVRQLEYQSRPILCSDGRLGIHCSCSKLNFEKEGKIFRAGETISASYVPTSNPINFPDLNGVKMELELKMYFKDPAAQMSYLVRDEKYSLGDGCTKRIGPNKEIDYTFSFTIPLDCPSSYEGTFGSLTYTLTRMEHQSAQDIHSFNPVEITIFAQTVGEWEDQKKYIQPMFTQKQVYAFLFTGKIQMWLNTDQQCYEAGDTVQFALKVKNGGGKGIRTMTLQLQQNVIFNSGTCVQIEKILFPQETGPSVPAGSTEKWNGDLHLARDLEPSIGDKRFNRMRNALKMDNQSPSIIYEYFLRVTFEMAGSLVPNIIEEFPIDIGALLDIPPSSSTNSNLGHEGHDGGGVTETCRLHPEAAALRKEGMGHMSMSSLAPSLPDYDAATATDASSASWDSTSGTNPPAYSCLHIETTGTGIPSEIQKEDEYI